MKKFVLQFVVLLVVLALWMSQSLFKTHRTEVEFPLIFSALPNQMLITEQTLNTVSVIVEGKGTDIVRLKRQNGYYIVVDGREFQPGDNEVTITESNIFIENQSFGGLLKFYLNRKLNLSVDKTETITLPIELRFLTMNDEIEYKQRNVTISPSHIEVVGASKILSKLKSVTTVPLTSQLIKDRDKLQQIDLEIPDGIKTLESNTVEISLGSPSNITRTIPLITINYPSDTIIAVIPPTVTIKAEGPPSEMRNITANSIVASVVVPKNNDQELADLKFDVPKGIIIKEYTPKNVQIIWK